MLYKTNLILISFFLCVSCGSPLENMTKERPLLTEAESELQELADYKVEIQWRRGPFPHTEENSVLEVRFYTEEGETTFLPMSYELFLLADMGMGHGLADRGEFLSKERHVFQNRDIKFYMGGSYTFSLLLYEGENEIGRLEWPMSL